MAMLMLYACGQSPELKTVEPYSFTPFTPPISYEAAGVKADSLLKLMTTDEKLELISGHNMFFIKGFERLGIPQLYLSDATQGVHIRKELSNLMEKSTAMPCPILLSATWNTNLAHDFAKSVGEECRAGDIGVLLGPGMNIYRVSTNGRNFEYFGEEPFLTARMIENYVVGVQNTGTMATLKHFACNNTDHHRRTTNSVVDERTLMEVYFPGFEAGINAGAMAVMTSYNQVNGEWAGQSSELITGYLRGGLAFKWLVMTDWWSVWDAEKIIKSGQDLEMPGDQFIKRDGKRLLQEGKVTIADIDRMAKNILRTEIAMGLLTRPVKDAALLAKLPEHTKVALQTAREGVVLLKNEGAILPLSAAKSPKILLTGEYLDSLARGGGSAEVEGYDWVLMPQAMKAEFGNALTVAQNPTDSQLSEASTVVLYIGTHDSEGYDKSFELPDSTVNKVLRATKLNKNVVVVLSAGRGVSMTKWIDKVKALVYAWYPGQNGTTAVAEILSGKTNPSGKLPITIEKKFEDSPGFPYILPGDTLYTGWAGDMDMKQPMNRIEYKEGVYVGYKAYEMSGVKPLFAFGFGLSYTTFAYSDLKIENPNAKAGEDVRLSFVVKNTGKVAGAEVAQLYVSDAESSVERPLKELKNFAKVQLAPGESVRVKMTLNNRAFAFFDTGSMKWKAEPGLFKIQVGAASDNILLTGDVNLK
jgi:beta-glucosidase